MTITGSYFFIGMLVLAVFFTWFAGQRKTLLVSLAGGLTWFGLGMWMFFSITPPVGLGETWQTVFAWVFFMMCFVPFLFLMDTETQHSEDGVTWKEYSGKPRKKTTSSYDRYFSDLKKRMRS